MKALLTELERKHPTLRQTMLAALGNVNPSHLYDRALQAARRRGGRAGERGRGPASAGERAGAMMARVAAGLLVVVAGSFAAGCDEDGPTGGPPRQPLPAVGFMTPDRSTGVRLASIWIGDSGHDVPLDS